MLSNKTLLLISFQEVQQYCLRGMLSNKTLLPSLFKDKDFSSLRGMLSNKTLLHEVPDVTEEPV